MDRELKPVAALADFIRACRPRHPGPLDEMRERHAEEKRDAARRGHCFPFLGSHDSRDYLVELRIRQWLQQRKDLEGAEAPKPPPPAPKKP